VGVKKVIYLYNLGLDNNFYLHIIDSILYEEFVVVEESITIILSLFIHTKLNIILIDTLFLMK
jgi:hypothetical protein